jgi:hypothetical protein
MRILIVSLALMLVASFTSTATAQGCASKSKSKETVAKADASACCHKDRAGCTKKAGDSDCNSKVLLACGAPTMKYKVGEKLTNCPIQANEWRGECDASVCYVVSGAEYADKAEAMKAYETALEHYLASMTSVRYVVGDMCVACPSAAAELAKENGGTVQYRVASFTLADKERAQKAADAARSASEKVTMTYVVDGKEYTCSKGDGEAKQAQQSSDTVQKCEYKVGDKKTCCEVTAKVELATARIIAAYRALEELGATASAGRDAVSGT